MTSSRGKLRIAVLFGGRSAEHDVSVMSATNVVGALEPSKYEAVPIFVTREGEWLLSHFENGVLARPANGTEIALVPGGRGRMIAIDGGRMSDAGKIDILFPVLHGIFRRGWFRAGTGGGGPRATGWLRHPGFSDSA